MKKNSVIVLLVFFLLVVMGGVYFQFFAKELDANADNSPIKSQKVRLQKKVLMDKSLSLAAGIAYDQYHDRFFVSTDLPHTLFPKQEAQVFMLDKNLQKIQAPFALKTAGDLEGIAVIDKTTLKVLSDTGELFTVSVGQDNSMTVVATNSVFSDKAPHKLSSLAFDGKYLYSAEKEGEKIFYKLSLDGELIKQFKLKDFPAEKEFTVAGMTLRGGFLYVLSEAYSTLFKVDLSDETIVTSAGIQQMNECAGITTDETLFYCVGDAESYIPEQNFFVFEME